VDHLPSTRRMINQGLFPSSTGVDANHGQVKRQA